MKHLSTIIGRLALLLLLPGVGMAQANDTDCNLDFTIEQGCSPDGTGYALITDLVSVIPPYEHVWSTGANTQFVAGLTNNDYSVTLTDAAGCSLTKYFTIDCEKKDEEDPKDPEPCQLRTQTMGGWGAPANGNNPGAYRDAHFAAAFPGGLVIGCNYTLTLTSAQAVQNFLPSGGQAKKLTANLLNPTNYKNVLAGQLVALTLSVGFDNNDPDFGTGGLLANAVINNGTFNGWTVQQLLDEANNFIGGCASSYSAGQLNTALTMVNENFVDGTTNNGKLDCSEEEVVDDKSMGLPGEMRTGEPTGDCNLDFTIEQGCSPDGTGYALITDLVSVIPPYEHVWSNGANTQFVSGLTNNDYSVTLTDAAGCSLTKYFTIDCEKKDEEEPKDPEPCQLRTQTQGGWGAPANGNNPGAYRNAHFAAAFPGGLIIGCEYTLTLTSAQAVQNFLPSGGQAKKLPANLLNPTNYKNVLAGQLVALTLSVGFDNNDPDFGSGDLLANAVINNGTFNGWTVQELLDEANNFIGGCPSSYTASQLNSALTMVNENFVDGTTNNGNLDCYKKDDEPTDDKALEVANMVDLLAFPNPAADRLNVNITAHIDGQVAVLMMDATGRMALPTSTVVLASGVQRTITMDVSGLANGTYMLSLELDGQRSVQRIIIAR